MGSGMAKLVLYLALSQYVCMVELKVHWHHLNPGTERCSSHASLLPLLVIKVRILIIRELKLAGSKAAFKDCELEVR